METPANILRAIAGESMARNKYTFFASKARKDGFEQIAAIFEETANNEKEHAKRLMKLLKGGEKASLEDYDFPVVSDTATNLGVAAGGEDFETTKMYPAFAAKAKEEGFEEEARVFTEIGEVEAEHEKRYLKLKKNIEDGMVFKKGEPKVWICRNCGYHFVGEEAPTECPACAHPQSYYELWVENY